MGVSTEAAASARALLTRAETELSTLAARARELEPSAPSEAAEQRYFAVASKVRALATAINELRSELGLPAYTEVPDESRRVTAAEVQAEIDAQVAACAAAEQAKRTARCSAASERLVDARGIRVVLRKFFPDGSAGRGSTIIEAEDGRNVSAEVVSSADGECRLVQASCNDCWEEVSWTPAHLEPVTTATSDWLPLEATVPPIRSTEQVQRDWLAAEQAEADEALLAKLSQQPEAWLAEREDAIRTFVAAPCGRFGGRNGRKFSARDVLQADFDEFQAAAKAATESEAARIAASPFAVLANFKRR